ncbi:MAG: hypothetical protein EB078_03285, partial [Proteobacteria bacterium]|nr:hypothetical protein [Pseudomonadota bacterium]
TNVNSTWFALESMDKPVILILGGVDKGNDYSLIKELVKEKVKAIVAQEPPKNPYSDQKIVELLLKENINIARRTVAKYREIMGILPSSKRKKVF